MHPALPQTFTPEKLAIWFSENAIDKRRHTEEIPLDDKSRQEFKDKIAFSTAAIYDLKNIEKAFKNSLNNGTVFNGSERLPEDFTIPPTKGLKELEANREYADGVLKKGFTTTETELFGIPYSKTKKVIFFDVEGKEFFDENMTAEQIEGAGKLFDGVEEVREDFHKNAKKMKDKGVTMKITDSKGKKLFDNSDQTESGDIDSSATGLFGE